MIKQTDNTLLQVREIAQAAGISPRTLRYYDQIGLLSPVEIGANGYRYYDEKALLKLQQILFFKKFGFKLAEIQIFLSSSDFDTIQTLETHKESLLKEIKRIKILTETIDHTIEHIKGERKMAKEEFFKGYDSEKQSEYETEVREKYGNQLLKQSQQRWGSYSKSKQDQVKKQGEEIILSVLDNMDKGFNHPDVQEFIKAWHQHMSHFYDCSLEVFEGIGHMYNDDPRFHKAYSAHHLDFPRFMQQAMTYYVETQD